MYCATVSTVVHRSDDPLDQKDQTRSDVEGLFPLAAG